MKKNLLDKICADSIIARVENLQATNKARWGNMNATEMLLHANLCNAEIFENKKPIKKTSVKQFLLRIVALYIAPNFKKVLREILKKRRSGK